MPAIFWAGWDIFEPLPIPAAPVKYFLRHLWERMSEPSPGESLHVGTGRPVEPLPLPLYESQARLSINRGWFVFGQFAFLMVPKCACTSIKMAFAARLRPGIFGDPSNALSVHGLDAPHGGRFVRWEQRSTIRGELQRSFCVLRDPLARFESFYRDKILGARRADAPGLHPDISRAGFDRRMSLHDCVVHLASIPPELWDQHVVPQYLLLHRLSSGRLVPAAKFVLKFENLSEEWRKLSALLPGLPDLPGSRFNRTDPADRVVMDEDSAARLRDFYRGDLEILSRL